MMQTTQGSMLKSLRGVRDFLDEHADRLNGIVQSGARKRLDDAIKALEGHVADQTGQTIVSRGLTTKQRAQREALVHDHMSAISRIAKADLPHTPEFDAFKMPRGRPTLEKLAGIAEGMAQAAQPFSDVFVNAGLPADFIAQLTTAASDMLGSVDARTKSKGHVSGATAAVKARLSEGRRVVHILDAFVQKALKGNTQLITNWNSVKRVQKTAGGTASTTTPEPAPAPVAAPVPGPAPSSSI